MITVTGENGTRLSLDNVDWKGHYVLAKASIGQIIRTLQNVKLHAEKKKSSVKPSGIKPYEMTLNEGLCDIISDLLDTYEKMLCFQSDIERDIAFFNIIVNLPKDIVINAEKHGQIYLNRANIGNLIQAMRQRVDFILNRDIPDRYTDDPEQLTVFNSLKEKLLNFKNDIDTFEQDFIDIIDKAHKSQQKYFGTKSRQRSNMSKQKYHPRTNQQVTI